MASFNNRIIYIWIATVLNIAAAIVLPYDLIPQSRSNALASDSSSQLSKNGFSNPSSTSSAGGNATCVTGMISVTATGNGTKILFSGPPNNQAATQLFVEVTQTNSSIETTTNGGPSIISGTFDLFSKLCVPASGKGGYYGNDGKTIKTVQFLTHGGTLDSSYWDLAPGFSYVDAVSEAGYATFSYDRLGSGKSDHPDPIQVVQALYQVEIAHILVQKLRAGSIGGIAFENVVGVGHSLGTGLTQGITTAFPKDFDAVILTGTSTNFAAVPLGVASTDMQLANTDPSNRFRNIANGYFTPAPVPQSVQFAFYKYPFFNETIFEELFKNVQTNSLGELFTLANAYTVSPEFTGPVDVVDGDSDYFYCGGDCTFPTDQAALVQPVFYPAASNGSQSFLVPNCGHLINPHFGAPKAFAQMISFLNANGILGAD